MIRLARPSRVRRLAAPLLALCSAAAIAACGTEPTAADGTPGGRAPDTLTALPRALTQGEQRAIEIGNEFSFRLLREVNARKLNENVFISPFSAAMALGMTTNGAAGETEAAMRRTLGFGTLSLQQMNDAYRGLSALLLTLDPSVKIQSANSIWYRQEFPVEQAFVDVTRRDYAADVRAANFADPATLTAINAWAEEKTSGKIKTILDRITARDVMFLINALYFKGSWRAQFDPAETRAATFTAAGGAAQSARLMHRQGTMRFYRGSGVQAVDLPYGNGAFSMTVLLPTEGGSADALVASLDGPRWSTIVNGLHDATVDLSLPKFRVEFEDRWNDVLTTMGMGIAFDERADFTRISRSGGLQIGFVKQKTFVDVNEEGTEAAAVTVVGIVRTSMPQVEVMRVDRPFVVVIRERFSNTILFAGKIASIPQTS
jgi:serpin B